MKVNLDKIDAIIIKDSDGNVIERFSPKQITHYTGLGGNVLTFVK